MGAWYRNKGILFVAIDQNRPLSDQGPFDIVLHKVWKDFSFPWTVSFPFFFVWLILPWTIHFRKSCMSALFQTSNFNSLIVFNFLIMPDFYDYEIVFHRDYRLISVKILLSIIFYHYVLRIYGVCFGLQCTFFTFKVSSYIYIFFHAVIRKGVAPDSWGWSF